MDNPQFFVGIDISKDTFDYVCINDKENIVLHEKLSMEYDAFNTFKSNLEKFNNSNLFICLEATGIYYLSLLSFLLDNGFTAAVVNPILINAFIKSLSLRKNKNDKKDALAIAAFAKRTSHSLKIASKQDLDTLKPLIRERESLAKSIAKSKTEIKGCLVQLFPELMNITNVFNKAIINLLLIAPSKSAIAMKKPNSIQKIFDKSKGNRINISPETIINTAKKSIGIANKNLEIVLISKIKRLILFQDELKALDELIQSNVDDNDDMNSNIEILKSIDGIGNITATNFIVEINDINHFKSHKQLSAYIGLDPATKQSGTSINVKGKITKRGNSYLRRTIYQMAVSVSRYNPVFKEYLHKKIAEGKKYRQAIIAVANKLLRVIFSLLKNKNNFVYD